MFPVVSRFGTYLHLRARFVCARLSAQVKLHTRKIRCSELNLFRPVVSGDRDFHFNRGLTWIIFGMFYMILL